MEFLLAAVSGFAGGILLRSLFVFGWPVIGFVLILVALAASATFLRPRKAATLGAVFFLLLALGVLRASLADSPLPEPFAASRKHRVYYEGIVAADPDLRDANQRVAIRVEQGDASTLMLAVAPREPAVAVGDRVSVSGTLQMPDAFATDGRRIFRYDKYLQVSGVRFILNYASIRVDAPAPWYSIGAALARIKHFFLDGLGATLPEPYASLAGGIVIGGKSGLGAALQNDFVRSGLVQIIVLSGYNVMIIAEWVMAGLAQFKMRRRWSALAGAVAILLFVGVAGVTATALRAALMALIALYARATGRSYAAGRALLTVIFLMLLYNPLYLAFDPGFGLSVAATAGLIWLAPGIETFLRIKNAFWKNALATTLSAQVAVLPLLLYDTGNLSLVAIPANLLAMPMVPAAMAASALAGVGGILFGHFTPLLGIIIAFPAYLLNLYLVALAQGASALPFAAFILPAFPFILVLACYAALIWLASSKRFSMTLQFKLEKKAST